MGRDTKPAQNGTNQYKPYNRHIQVSVVVVIKFPSRFTTHPFWDVLETFGRRLGDILG